MAKFVTDTVIDAALSTVQLNVSAQVVNIAQPGTYASAVGGKKLAEAALVAASMTIQNGDVSGRRLSIPQQTGITVSTTGTATHTALVGNSSIWVVDTATTQVLTSGNTLTINGWDLEIQDPS